MKRFEAGHEALRPLWHRWTGPPSASPAALAEFSRSVPTFGGRERAIHTPTYITLRRARHGGDAHGTTMVAGPFDVIGFLAATDRGLLVHGEQTGLLEGGRFDVLCPESVGVTYTVPNWAVSQAWAGRQHHPLYYGYLQYGNGVSATNARTVVGKSFSPATVNLTDADMKRDPGMVERTLLWAAHQENPDCPTFLFRRHRAEGENSTDPWLYGNLPLYLRFLLPTSGSHFALRIPRASRGLILRLRPDLSPAQAREALDGPQGLGAFMAFGEASKLAWRRPALHDAVPLAGKSVGAPPLHPNMLLGELSLRGARGYANFLEALAAEVPKMTGTPLFEGAPAAIADRLLERGYFQALLPLPDVDPYVINEMEQNGSRLLQADPALARLLTPSMSPAGETPWIVQVVDLTFERLFPPRGEVQGHVSSIPGRQAQDFTSESHFELPPQSFWALAQESSAMDIPPRLFEVFPMEDPLRMIPRIPGIKPTHERIGT